MIETTVAMQGTCVAFGSFDGVHIGHRAVAEELVRHSEYIPAVVTFATPEDGPKVLTTEAEKRYLLMGLGVRAVISFPAEEAQSMAPEDFVRGVLVEQLGAKAVVVGEEFTFGKDGAGTVELLEKLGEKYGYTVTVCGTVRWEDEPVSIARIWDAFGAKDFEKAAAMLGHPYIMMGTIVHGKAEGRTVGMPTANLGVPANKQFPPHGVYATLSIFDGAKHRGMTNIGLRPSADTIPKPTIETFVLNFSGDLYDKETLLEVHRYIRGVQKFANLAAVKEQVQKDIVQVHEYLEKIGQ